MRRNAVQTLALLGKFARNAVSKLQSFKHMLIMTSSRGKANSTFIINSTAHFQTNGNSSPNSYTIICRTLCGLYIVSTNSQRQFQRSSTIIMFCCMQQDYLYCPKPDGKTVWKPWYIINQIKLLINLAGIPRK